MNRRLPFTARLAAALFAFGVGVYGMVGSAGAEPVTFQEGLPPALTIQVERAADGSISQEDLRAQIDSLGKLGDWAEQARPKRGWLEKILGSSEGPNRTSLWELPRSFDAFRGKRIVVEGLYERSEHADGVFHTAEGRCLISLAEGAEINGFGDDEPYGLPVKVEATVEGNATLPILRALKITPALGLALLRQARAYDLAGNYKQAVETYANADTKLLSRFTDLASFSRVRAGDIAYEQLSDRKLAQKHYNAAWDGYVTNTPDKKPTYYTWQPRETENGGEWGRVKVHTAAAERLDNLNSESFWYKFVDVFVTICGGSVALGVILLAVLVRLLIWPLTKKQLASAAAMKKLQPQIKKLQDKHSDDKQKFQQEFWELCQANNVNPLGGCLPLLVQLPMLIMIYKGIRLYIVHFTGMPFLWMEDLASPDLILLIAYTLSMILFQKMSQRANPQAAMDPQQEQQQKLMMYLMPVMFFFIFRTFPAAFILYWLGMNLTYFAQQWRYMSVQEQETDETQGAEKTPQKAGGIVGAITRLLSGEPGDVDAREQGLANPGGHSEDAGDEQEPETDEDPGRKKRQRR